MSAKKNNAAKGRRYTVKEKEEIIAFVDKVNSERGRGGQTAASKKFNISQLTISSWIRGGISSSRSAILNGGSHGPISKKLAKLQDLHNEIVKCEKSLAKLRNDFHSIKASI